ncbi:MAG TPA: amino acid adenylation domain-containing protein [Bosea sp. (in: a-proteobacteria)]|jgi:amino acid adenylation domain-containing protein/non-ribosomal peptide synthase protein (TIGR01720 family)|uniref:amino acid adenylation domain-containing protein n=1 Tax=Bosea sp. (in: a-proteobacteria) TaxID=1871050 RepID=UPI002E0DE6C5|nr:amino acid adenylation domain-containing protein [Bosea sp. (in: a-proteobacteria)]
MNAVTPNAPLAIPLAVVTQRIWLECKRAPDSSAYFVPFVYRLDANVDPQRLEQALRATVDAHPALRSVVAEVDGKPFQVVKETPAQVLECADSWEWAITKPFDMENGPLFRFVLCGDIFVINGSHLILDGGSILLLLEEVSARYHGRAAPEPGPGPEAWRAHENAYLESPEREADRAYWAGTLAQSDFRAGLPTRRESYAGEQDGNLYFSLRLPQMNVSPFITTLALIQALIHRYTEQEMVAVLYPTDLRGKKFARSMGSFVNSLIATASFTPELSFAQLVAQVQEQRRATRAHDRLSFQEVIAGLRKARPSDAVQLPNVSVSWAKPLWPFELGTPLPLETVDCQNDLLFLAFAEGDRLDLRLQYSARQFTRRFVEEIAAHLSVLADLVAAEPHAPLSKLMLATPAEVERIERDWTPAPAPRSDLLLLHDAFSDWAERQPEAPALLTRERVISYGEMERLTNRIAHGLRRRGVKPNTLVGVMMEKGWEQAVACMAILKAGGGYLPINAGWPAERMDAVISQGDVAVVLSQKRVVERLGRPGLAVDDEALWAGEPDTRPTSVNALGDICYVLFTSGSTGKPKGVTLTHFSVMNTLRNANEEHRVGPGDRSLQLSDFAFDLSVYDIFGMLSAGAGVVIPDENRHLEPLHWVEIARQHQASIWTSVPMYVDMWAQSGEPMPSMRVFMMGGDKIPVDLPERIRQLAPRAALWSVGGPTETSIISNWYRIGEVDPIWTTIPYGRAMLNQKMLVLDSGLNQCPPFMPGRIFMGGVCLARGYWKDKEKTDAAFVTYPATGERIYYTGDLGRWLPDGQVEFLGRADFQVKINGFRIELGEIEGAIQSLPGVKAAIVDGQEQPDRKGKFLVAYAVSSTPLDAAEMRAALQDRLPYYMIPRVFAQLDRIPLSANGKVDRKALPRVEVARTADDLPYVAPRTPIEAALVDVWQFVLEHEPIGIHDNFYALGGDSLLAVLLGIRAREAGVPFDPATLQRTPTIAELAQSLTPARKVETGMATGEVPLSPMQRYYFSWATERPEQFNVSAVFRCAVEPDRLRTALAKLVAHHDALRLRFDGARQFYAEGEVEVPLECADIPLAEVGARAARMQETLDIARGPIMRAGLFTTEDGQRLVLICHHLVTDGLSWGALVSDLQRAYLGEALPPSGGSYKGWVEALIAFASSSEAEAQLPFWLGQQGPTFGADNERPGARQRDIVTYESDMLDAVPPNAYERVAAALLEATGQDRLMLHVVGHGRESVVGESDPTRICGWFTSHTPIVLSGGLKDVAGQLRAMPDHGIAHGALRAYHPRGAELAGQDQVKILYNFFGETWDSSFRGAVFEKPEDELLYLKNHAHADNPADFRLYLMAIITEGRLKVRFQYSAINYDAEAIRDLADRMRTSLLAHAGEPVGASA